MDGILVYNFFLKDLYENQKNKQQQRQDKKKDKETNNK